MLCSLSISNYALIRELNITLPKGLSLITGETGAGKSILLGALSLVLGQRADSDVLKDKQTNAVVEAGFSLPPQEDASLPALFDANQVDFDRELVLRRIITPAGKSRSFVNDQPVPLSFMKELGLRLIDIHSQHEHLLLSGSTYPLKVVDAYAGSAGMLPEYSQLYKQASLLEEQVRVLRQQVEQQALDQEYLQFQYNQLHEAALQPGEQEDLEAEQELLSHATQVQDQLCQVTGLLNGWERSVLVQLKEAHKLSASVASLVSAFESFTDRIDSMRVECKDIADECQKAAEKVQANPKRLEEVALRLQLIYDLERKHQVKTVEELIALRDGMQSRLGGAQDNRIRLLNLQKEWTLAQSQMLLSANKLHLQRADCVEALSHKIETLLLPLGMLHARVEFRLEQTAECTPAGNTQVQLWFSANKDMPMREIGKVASGGELSRLMLCIKSLVAARVGLHTIVFDEVDVGVSGKIADCMGNMICDLAHQIQVVAITHLPQVAAKGEAHFLVTKEVDSDAVSTQVRALTPQERIMEVARMLSGAQITPAAIENAKELLNSH